MSNMFDGKVAIVTGGSSGIGRALSEQLSRRGAVVIVADIDIEGAQQIASAITTGGARAKAVHVDTHGQSPWHFTAQASLDLNPDVIAISHIQ
jgi:3-oxoacyl-[acyl-carrier protein] reductase